VFDTKADGFAIHGMPTIIVRQPPGGNASLFDKPANHRVEEIVVRREM